MRSSWRARFRCRWQRGEPSWISTAMTGRRCVILQCSVIILVSGLGVGAKRAPRLRLAAVFGPLGCRLILRGRGFWRRPDLGFQGGLGAGGPLSLSLCYESASDARAIRRLCPLPTEAARTVLVPQFTPVLRPQVTLS